jgi:hypothetical protein
VTHFDDREIARFAWSHDGMQLAIVRKTTTNDVVLLNGLKEVRLRADITNRRST